MINWLIADVVSVSGKPLIMAFTSSSVNLSWTPPIHQNHAPITHYLIQAGGQRGLTYHLQEKDKDRREGKGRRCWLEDKGYFTPGWFEGKDEFVLFFLWSLCNSSYSSYGPGANHPVLQIALVQIDSAARNLINSVPQAAVTTFAFSFVFILLLHGSDTHTPTGCPTGMWVVNPERKKWPKPATKWAVSPKKTWTQTCGCKLKNKMAAKTWK